MDERYSIGIQQCSGSSDMDVSESIKTGESSTEGNAIREELPNTGENDVVSPKLPTDTVKIQPEAMIISSCFGDMIRDQIVLATSPSIHSHSTGGHSHSIADSIASTMSSSSEIISSHIIHKASHTYGNCNKDTLFVPDYNNPTNDEQNLLAGGKKTVSSDEHNADIHYYEARIDTEHEPNRDRSDSMPCASNDWTTSPSLSSKALRRGKWTQEEEAFVARTIHDFNCGFLNVPAGTTLRTYLSDKLQCNPMRVTKKFTGDACIGKRVFHPAVRSESNAAAIDRAQVELEALESRWRRRLESQHKESQKKTSSSALNPSHNIQNQLIEADPSSLRENSVDISQAVSWLEQANSILSHDARSKQDYATEMEQVQRLIVEAPIIHNISTGIPTSLIGSSLVAQPDQSNASAQTILSVDCKDIKRKVVYKSSPVPSPILRPIALEHTLISGPDFVPYPSKESQTIKSMPSPPPQDEKRLRTTNVPQETTPACIEESAAEDAATLMDFLFSVRNEASAASKT